MDTEDKLREPTRARRNDGRDMRDDDDDDDIRKPVIRMLGKPAGRSGFSRRRVCRFCTDTTVALDYKNPGLLRNYITDRGKLIPRRITGNCARHQRALALAVRRSRMIALVPFTVTGR